jgi:GMP synthase (glutamine-hydrolysing)
MAVRILGDVTEGDRLRVLQEVDEIYINTIKEYGLYDEIWQVRGRGGGGDGGGRRWG